MNYIDLKCDCFNKLFTGDNANMFLNENWREILHELMPAIEQVFSAAFVQIGEQFLKRIPMNQILLD